MDTAMTEQQITELQDMNDDELLRQLGVQMYQAEQHDDEGLQAARELGHFPEPEGVEMGFGENFRAIGSRWWASIEVKLYDLLCKGDNEDREKILAALPASATAAAPAVAADADDHERSATQVASVLAPILVGLIPFQIPMVASIAAMIAARMVISSGLKATCDFWSESMAARKEAEQPADAPTDAPADPAEPTA